MSGARHNLFIKKGAIPDAALVDAYHLLKERIRPGGSKKGVDAEKGGRREEDRLKSDLKRKKGLVTFVRPK